MKPGPGIEQSAEGTEDRILNRSLHELRSPPGMPGALAIRHDLLAQTAFVDAIDRPLTLSFLPDEHIPRTSEISIDVPPLTIEAAIVVSPK
jgi:hypothetical protein